MGREIRMVPPNWEHPKKDYPNYRSGTSEQRYQPMFDREFAPAMREWIADWDAWERGERPDYCSEESAALQYWEYNGAGHLTLNITALNGVSNRRGFKFMKPSARVRQYRHHSRLAKSWSRT